METKRLQVDLTEKEQAEMDRLCATAGLKTKREFVLNALTLFRWAAHEIASGRLVGSFAPGVVHVKQLEMPCLMPFAEIAAALARQHPSPAELEARVTGPTVPISEAIALLRKPLERKTDERAGELQAGVRHSG